MSDEADQQVPAVRDARIREHALEVRLRHADHRAGESWSSAAISYRSTGAHWAVTIGSSADKKTRTNAMGAAAFTPVDMKPVTTAGAPS